MNRCEPKIPRATSSGELPLPLFVRTKKSKPFDAHCFDYIPSTSTTRHSSDTQQFHNPQQTPSRNALVLNSLRHSLRQPTASHVPRAPHNDYKPTHISSMPDRNESPNKLPSTIQQPRDRPSPIQKHQNNKLMNY